MTDAPSFLVLGATPPDQHASEQARRTERLQRIIEAQVENVAAAPDEPAWVKGESALHRLLLIAHGKRTNTAKVVARFLLNPYHGQRFPIDLILFRQIADDAVFADCVAVLTQDRLNNLPFHGLVPDGQAVYEGLAIDWAFEGQQSVLPPVF
ncbi:hypothetical protein R0381_002596 [Jeongeupia wiesaeckerbachi]|uniref:DUF7673 family protein n=1 Tax=Jeongeupia wiesaeckerbachi TaxID=3051218 RepID=UPI003D805E4D